MAVVSPKGAVGLAMTASVGLAAALGVGKLVVSMLYGLKPYDPAILIGAGAVLVAIAFEASWVPAQRV